MVMDDTGAVADWRTMMADGSVRLLRLSLREVNEAFSRIGDERAARRRERGAPDDVFIDMYVGLVS
jgi:NosR/NirI family nitrous oxide reductase transcriptional regulator